MSRLKRYGPLLAAGLLLALGIALLSPLASSSPDGLEKVAEEHEFLDQAEDPGYEFIPDYQFPGVEDERLATVLAGIVGVLVVAGATLGTGLLLARRSRARDGAGTGTQP